MTSRSATRRTRRGGHRALGVFALVALVGLNGCSNESHERIATKDCRTGADAATADAPDLDPPTAPASELGITDELEGCGDAISAGVATNVTVNYLGKAQSTGEVFDSSFDRGEPISFAVGAGKLIQGWDEGLVGMKEGGRRILLVPGDLAYGDMGMPPDIGPDDTLVFAVDLVSIDA